MKELKCDKQITGKHFVPRDFYPRASSKPVAMKEEIELIRLTKEGDRNALEALVVNHHSLVVCIAKRFQNNGLSLHGLIIEGNVGFAKAIYHFNENKGFKFTSYAIWCIRHSILRTIVKSTANKPLPMNGIGLIRQGTSLFYNKLGQYFQQEPSPEEIAGMYNFEMKIKMEALQESSNQLSGIDFMVSEKRKF